jgi:acylphosphatase
MGSLYILVFGTVQGVFFRSETQNLAKKLGLVGWVKNNKDGSVEIMASGERKTLEKLLEWCYHGPAGAKVTEIEFRWMEFEEKFDEFKIII